MSEMKGQVVIVPEQETVPTSSSPATGAPWRVRVSHWYWRKQSFVWETLIAGIVISTFANFNTTETEKNKPLIDTLSQLVIVRFVQAYPLLFLCIASTPMLLTLLSWLGSREKD